MIHFGPAGWLYKDWEGIVYPVPKPKGFDPLAYYGSPLPATADKWVARENAGVEARYDYLYSKEELEPWTARAVEVASHAPESYVVTNNHYKGKAVTNAAMLKAMVEKKPAAVPPTLLKAYPRELNGLAKPAE